MSAERFALNDLWGDSETPCLLEQSNKLARCIEVSVDAWTKYVQDDSNNGVTVDNDLAQVAVTKQENGPGIVPPEILSSPSIHGASEVTTSGIGAFINEVKALNALGGHVCPVLAESEGTTTNDQFCSVIPENGADVADSLGSPVRSSSKLVEEGDNCFDNRLSDNALSDVHLTSTTVCEVASDRTTPRKRGSTTSHLSAERFTLNNIWCDTLFGIESTTDAIGTSVDMEYQHYDLSKGRLDLKQNSILKTCTSFRESKQVKRVRFSAELTDTFDMQVPEETIIMFDSTANEETECSHKHNSESEVINDCTRASECISSNEFAESFLTTFQETLTPHRHHNNTAAVIPGPIFDIFETPEKT